MLLCHRISPSKADVSLCCYGQMPTSLAMTDGGTLLTFCDLRAMTCVQHTEHERDISQAAGPVTACEPGAGAVPEGPCRVRPGPAAEPARSAHAVTPQSSAPIDWRSAGEQMWWIGVWADTRTACYLWGIADTGSQIPGETRRFGLSINQGVGQIINCLCLVVCTPKSTRS